MQNKKFFVFAGAPSVPIMVSGVVEAESRECIKVEEAVDALIDFVDCGHTLRCVWAVFDSDTYSFADSCKNFGYAIFTRNQRKENSISYI